MRKKRRSFTAVAALSVIALLSTACGGSEPAATPGDDEAPAGEPVTVASFNFPESTILAEIYAQAMENAGIEVQRQLNLGARELIFPQLNAGELDFIAEYLGSAIQVGFGEEPAPSTDEAVEQLSDLFAEEGVTVLEPSEAQNRNVFVVTSEFAEANDVSAIGDLADAGELTLAGGPECESRETCFLGLTEIYGLDNVSFQTIQEKAPRIAALRNGEVDIILLFSTDPLFEEGTLVQLDDPEEMIPPENIVPVVNSDAADAYGEQLTGVVNEISATLTTEMLVELNAAAAEGIAPAEIAAQWLTDNGFLESEG